jgi:general secretion pathway protein G
VVPDEFGMTFLKKGRVPLDPWERPYGFELPKAGDAEPRIFTLGSDGAPGGEGLARDVDNFMIRNRDV